MYINSAYLNNHIMPIADDSESLIVTSCGNYRIKTRRIFETRRPNGRKDYQLLYIASGKAHFFKKDKEFIVSAGNIIVYKPNEPQNYIYYKDEKPDVYWVHFTGYDVENILESYDINADESILYAGTSPDYQWLFGQIIQELQLCRPRYEELLPLLLKNIFILISRGIENSKKFSDAMEKEMAFAVHYFRTHYNTEINIDKYAVSCNMSTSCFIRNFRNITGKTPLQYILSLRISNAQSLLENTDYSVSEISMNVGYDNPLYFSRLFHKQTGMSPREYRRKRNI